jgi:hypothetical protein
VLAKPLLTTAEIMGIIRFINGEVEVDVECYPMIDMWVLRKTRHIFIGIKNARLTVWSLALCFILEKFWIRFLTQRPATFPGITSTTE